MARYEGLDMEYKIATTFSLGMLISSYDYQLRDPEHYTTIVTALNDMNIPPESMVNLPSLIFMLPSFYTPENENNIQEVVEKLSSVYFVVFRDKLDLLTSSTILLGWARSAMFNGDLMDQLIGQVLSKHAEGTFFEEGAELEAVNMLMGLSQLGYKHEELLEILHEHLVSNESKESQYDLHTLYNIISAFARLDAQNTSYFTDYAPLLHNCLNTANAMPRKTFDASPELLYHMIPDLTTY